MNKAVAPHVIDKDAEKEQEEKLKEYLLAPNIEPMETHTQASRRNLLLVSMFGLLISYLDELSITSGSLLGLKVSFSNVSPAPIYWACFFVLVYLLVNFTCLIWCEYSESKIRLTGIKIPQAKDGFKFSSAFTQHAEASSERQSSIYSWWTSRIGELRKGFENADTTKSSPESVENLDAKLKTIEAEWDYIKGALNRFEKSFWVHKRRQYLQWLILTAAVPVLLGLSSIGFIGVAIYNLQVP